MQLETTHLGVPRELRALAITVDPKRFVEEPHAFSPHRGAEIHVLRDTASGDCWMFKRAAGGKVVGGIDAASQPRRAVAAARLAEALGVATPPITLAQFNGEYGTLQPLLPNVIRADLHEWGRRSHTVDEVPDALDRQRSDIAVLDYVMRSLDRVAYGLHNLLIDETVAGTPRLVAIDNDLTFPVRDDPGYDSYIRVPQHYTRAMVSRLQDLSEHPAALRALVESLLQPPEIASVRRRIGELIGDVDARTAAGEDVYFATTNESG